MTLGVYIVVYCDALVATSGIFKSDGKGEFYAPYCIKKARNWFQYLPWCS